MLEDRLKEMLKNERFGLWYKFKERERKSWLKPFVVKIIAEAETSTIDYNDWII